MEDPRIIGVVIKLKGSLWLELISDETEMPNICRLLAVRGHREDGRLYSSPCSFTSSYAPYALTRPQLSGGVAHARLSMCCLRNVCHRIQAPHSFWNRTPRLELHPLAICYAEKSWESAWQPSAGCYKLMLGLEKLRQSTRAGVACLVSKGTVCSFLQLGLGALLSP